MIITALGSCLPLLFLVYCYALAPSIQPVVYCVHSPLLRFCAVGGGFFVLGSLVLMCTSALFQAGCWRGLLVGLYFQKGGSLSLFSIVSFYPLSIS
jgi:hypothetical protein